MKVVLSSLNSKFIHTALSLRYLKAYAEKQNENRDLEIAEYTINQNINYIVGELYRKKPDLLCLSVYIWNINEIIDIVKSLKIVRPELKILLGGPEVSFEIKSLMENIEEIDYIIYGEGEIAFSEFLDYFEGKKEIIEVSNLAYRKDDQIIINPMKPVMKDLGEIPDIYSEDLSEYEDKIIYYESSRGCPFTCKFCLSSTIDGVRFFPLERVFRELKIFIDGKVKQVKFIDRTFNARIDYAKGIMKYAKENDNGISNFHFEVTAHLIDDEFIEFLSHMPEGLFQFEIGVQSTNEKTIRDVARTTDFKKLSNAVNKIRKLGNIHLHLDLIAGLPYEGYDSFKKSFNDVYNLKPDKLQLGFLKLLKGSQLRNEAKKHGIKYLDKSPYEVLETKYLSFEEVLKLKDIEELVEIYGNEKYFEKTLDIVLKDYESPFDFYEIFSKYCRKNGFYEAARGKVVQYRFLYEFLLEENKIDKDIAKEALRFDFVRNTRSPNVPKFLQSEDYYDMRNSRREFISDESIRKEYFPEFTERDQNKLTRFVHLDKFKYDILNGNSEERERIYAFLYNKSERALTRSTVLDITDKFNI
ncbi:MAG: B12-binding domain-containing radical SAM protein [Andreesenia angusta]|nr:B12-binding domain-containing radical SAM protein [Andreesenia angusta]